MGTRKDISILSSLYLMVQGQTHLELTQCNRIHSKCKNHTEQEIPADIYTIFSGPKSA